MEEQGQIYNAIFEYALDFKEQNLKGICKTVFTLIKPQLDANIKRYNNGTIPKVKQDKSKTKAKRKQTTSKTEANVNVNDNDNDNVNNNDNFIYRAFEHLVLTKDEFENILSLGYVKTEIDNMLDTIENYKGSKNYKSLNLTLQNWLRKEYPNRKPQVVKPKLHRPPVNRYMSYKDYAEDVKNPEFTEQQYNDELRLMLKDEYKWLHATN